MKSAPSALRRFVLFLTLASLAVPLAATSGTVVQKPRPRGVRPAPVAVNKGIIALPLTPIVATPQRSCGGRTPSGLGYTMLRPASGAKPAADATVLVNYIGYLATTGAVFDQGMRSPLPLDGVIAGFSQGVQMVARTGVIRICIPAAMGYGAQASGPIPANSDLVFQVELLDFKTAAELRAEQHAPVAEPAAQPDGAPQ